MEEGSQCFIPVDAVAVGSETCKSSCDSPDNMLMIVEGVEPSIVVKLEKEKPASVKVKHGWSEDHEAAANDNNPGPTITWDDIQMSPLDQDSGPAHATRSPSWWRQRFAALAVHNDNLNHVAVDVYKERKEICPEELRNRFFYRQVARELVDMVDDSATPITWRHSILTLCHFLAVMALDNEDKSGAKRKAEHFEEGEYHAEQVEEKVLAKRVKLLEDYGSPTK